jgi:hypothetical protein
MSMQAHTHIVIIARWARAAGAALLTAAASAGAADAEWQAARDRWLAADLAAYEYGYQKYCECHREAPPETLVTVRSGEVIAVRHRPQGTDVEVPAEARNLEFYWTVDGLFALLQSALERGVEVRAQYHESLGYPTQLYIDYDSEFIGDELDLRLTRVTALP